MDTEASKKRYGIRCSLPPDDPMSDPHLLGPDWQAFRWFETIEERDAFYADYSREHLYSRRGDKPSVIYTKIER